MEKWTRVCRTARGLGVLASSRFAWFFVAVLVLGSMVLDVSREIGSVASDSRLGSIAMAASDGVVLGAQSDNVVVGMHISDTHVDLGVPARIAKLEEWATVVIPTINPAFVLHSGDLTEGYSDTFFSSEQQLPEWVEYRRIVRLAGLNDTSKYADVRGNHDGAPVTALDSPNNYYRKYGAWGPTNAGTDRERSYQAVFNTSHGTYRAVVVDLAPLPGPSIPFNNGGNADDDMRARLDGLLGASGPWAGTLVVSHYPMTYVRQGEQVLDVVKKHKVTAILCGHTHSDDMTANRGEFLELEVGAIKESYFVRVFAFDHGLFSHREFVIGEWPVVLPINPKHAGFYTLNEPLSRIRASTHVRVLVWSPRGVSNVSIALDGSMLCANATQSPDNPALFTCRWSPSTMAGGMHTLTIDAVDGAGKRRTVQQPFSVDGTAVAPSRSTFSLLLRLPFRTIHTLGFLLALLPIWLSAVAGFVITAHANRQGGKSILGPAPEATVAWWKSLLQRDREAVQDICSVCRCTPDTQQSTDVELAAHSTESTQETVGHAPVQKGQQPWWKNVAIFLTLRWQHLAARFAVLSGKWRLTAVVYGFWVYAGPLWIAPMFGPVKTGDWAVTGTWGTFWKDGYIYSPEYSQWWCALWAGFVTMPLLQLISTMAYLDFPSSGMCATELAESSVAGFFLVLFTGFSTSSFINNFGVGGWAVSAAGLPHLILVLVLLGNHVHKRFRSCKRGRTEKVVLAAPMHDSVPAQ